MASAGKQDVAPGAANKAAELSAFASGYFFSKSVHLSKIANHLTKAQRESNVVRLSRFLNNKGVSVDEWYAPQARAVLERLSTAGTQIRLIIDGSKVGFSHQLLMLSVAYRRRAIPLVWTWVKHQRGHSPVAVQKALLEQVHELMPQGAKVALVGDSEFGNPNLLALLESWGWLYALRQSGRERYRDQAGDWHKLNKALREGESKVLGKVLLTKVHPHPTKLVHWHKGEKQPWLLATNFPDKKTTLKAYNYRMWTEIAHYEDKSSRQVAKLILAGVSPAKMAARKVSRPRLKKLMGR